MRGARASPMTRMRKPLSRAISCPLTAGGAAGADRAGERVAVDPKTSSTVANAVTMAWRITGPSCCGAERADERSLGLQRTCDAILTVRFVGRPSESTRDERDG